MLKAELTTGNIVIVHPMVTNPGVFGRPTRFYAADLTIGKLRHCFEFFAQRGCRVFLLREGASDAVLS